jgi:NAD(P)H dehydrogenase (quinone)
VAKKGKKNMKISIILAHPEKKSFNHAIASAVVETLISIGHKVFFHDLYEERFDAILTTAEIPKGSSLPPEIEMHCSEITEADGIIIIHPNWWGQPPAILKGWSDRIFRPGVAYEFVDGDKGEGVPNGLLRAKAAIVFNTSNTSIDREIQAFGDPLETIWKNCIFGLCGVDNFYRKTFNVVVTSSDEQRKEWLSEVRQTVTTYFPGGQV